MQYHRLFTVKHEVGSKACCRGGWVKVKVGIKGHVALRLAIIHKVLDVNSAITIGVHTVPFDLDVSIQSAACSVKHGHNLGPFLQFQVVNIEHDVLTILARNAVGEQHQIAAVTLERQFSVYQAGLVVHIQEIVLIDGPMPVTNHWIIAKKPHPHLIISESCVASQVIAGLTLDVPLIEHEVKSLPLDATLDINLGVVIPSAWSVTHVGVKGEVLVVQLIGTNGNRVYIGITIADAVGQAIEIEASVTAHLATDVTEVELILLQVALDESVGTHVHVEVKTGHRLFQALHVNPSLVILALNLLGGILEVVDQRRHSAGRIQVGIIVLVLNHNAGEPRSAVQRRVGIIGNEITAVELPVQVGEMKIGIPLLGAQVDVALGMKLCRTIAHAIIHPQVFQVQVTHIAVGSKDVVVITDGTMGVHIEVTTLIGARSVHVGKAAAQLASGLDVAVASAVVTHAAQIDCRIGPGGTAIGVIKSVTLCLDAGREALHVIVGKERLDREIVERGIHVIVLVAHVIVAIATHGSATSGDAQVARHIAAAFLVDLATQFHGRQFHAIQAEHLVEHTGITQIDLSVQVGLHAVKVGGIVDGSLALDAPYSWHIGIQRLHIDTFLVASGLGLDAHGLVVGNVFQRLAGLWHELLHLVEVNLTVGVDGGFAVRLAVEHILVNMGIHLDVTALGLEFHVIKVKTVLVLAHGAAGILDLEAAALLAREVLHGHFHVFAVILKVIDGGIHVFYLDIVRIERRARFIGFLARLAIFALAIVQAHLVGLDLPGLIILVISLLILGHGMIFAILLGVFLARVLIVHVGLVNIQ